MLQTLALAAALSTAPAQNSALALTNERTTFGGEFGPTRPSAQYLPGDIFFLAFDIENLVASPEGVVKYSIGMEVTDAAGQSVYAAKPADQDVTLPLGGGKLPAHAFVIIKPEQPPGKLTCKVTVTDRVTNATKTVAKAFEVLPADFGVIGLTTTFDPDARDSAPLFGVAGQTIWLNFAVVRMGFDAQTKKPNVSAELRVFENGKPTLEKPLSFGLDPKVPVDEKEPIAVFKIPVPLNREGSFTVELKAECKVTGKTYKMSFPVKVAASPK